MDKTKGLQPNLKLDSSWNNNVKNIRMQPFGSSIFAFFGLISGCDSFNIPIHIQYQRILNHKPSRLRPILQLTY